MGFSNKFIIFAISLQLISTINCGLPILDKVTNDLENIGKGVIGFLGIKNKQPGNGNQGNNQNNLGFNGRPGNGYNGYGTREENFGSQTGFEQNGYNNQNNLGYNGRPGNGYGTRQENFGSQTGFEQNGQRYNNQNNLGFNGRPGNDYGYGTNQENFGNHRFDQNGYNQNNFGQVNRIPETGFSMNRFNADSDDNQEIFGSYADTQNAKTAKDNVQVSTSTNAAVVTAETSTTHIGRRIISTHSNCGPGYIADSRGRCRENF